MTTNHKKKAGRDELYKQKNAIFGKFKFQNMLINEGLTEEISQAEVLAISPLLVIDIRLDSGVVPTQGVTHRVVLVSIDRS